jgi:hypothetical protein
MGAGSESGAIESSAAERRRSRDANISGHRRIPDDEGY